MQRLLAFLRPDRLPRMARPSYLAERQHMSLWAVVVGAVEGSTAGIIVSNTFHGSELLTTFVWAIPLLANVLNIVWGAVLRGRRRVPLFLVLGVCTITPLFTVALTPTAWHPWGGWLFAAQLTLTHIFLSALVNLRSSIWKANYPQSRRGEIAGHLQTIGFSVIALTGALLGLLFDQRPGYYRFVYPTVALAGLISLWPMRRVRIRGERGELRRFHEHLARLTHGLPPAPHRHVWAGLREVRAILRHDTTFSQFMTAQFFLGSANFMVDPVLVNVLTKDLRLGYFIPNLLLLLIPMTLLIATIGTWARYFDRVGVLRFRVQNTLYWIGSVACVGAAMLIISAGGPPALWVAMPLLVVGRVVNGIARAGGAIAWNLGHLHFAGPHQADLYMGIHVALTGLRGLLMPFVAVALNRAIGWGSFMVAVILSSIALLMFRRLYRRDRRAALAREAHAHELAAPARPEAT